jgi:hypothetical protein
MASVAVGVQPRRLAKQGHQHARAALGSFEASWCRLDGVGQAQTPTCRTESVVSSCWHSASVASSRASRTTVQMASTTGSKASPQLGMTRWRYRHSCWSDFISPAKAVCRYRLATLASDATVWTNYWIWGTSHSDRVASLPWNSSTYQGPSVYLKLKA